MRPGVWSVRSSLVQWTESPIRPPAGLGAGMMEAILAVTPSETIKTKLIDDANRPNPQYRGLVHGTVAIIRQEGIFGIYRGLFPVVSLFGIVLTP